MGVEEAIEQHLPGYPEGEPGDIRDAARAFEAAASSLEWVFGSLTSEVAGVNSSWQAADYDAFRQEFAEFRATAAEFEGQLRDTATQLYRMADELEAAQTEYRNALIEIGISVALGVAFSVITFGAGSGASAAVVAARVAVVIKTITSLRTAVAVALRLGAEFVRHITPRLAVFAGSDIAAQAVSGAITRPDHNPIKGIDLQQSAIVAASGVAAGGLSGLFGRLAQSSSPLRQAGARTAGGALGSVGVDVGQQAALTGKVDTRQVVVTGLLDGAGSRSSKPGADPFRAQTQQANGTNAIAPGAPRSPANNTTRKGDHSYRTDILGRVARVEGVVKMGDRVPVNPKLATEVRGEGRLGDQAGHLIAKIFGGSEEKINLVAQAANLNQGAYRAVERRLANALSEGKEVHIVVRLGYVDGSSRPDRFIIWDTIDGRTTRTKLFNEPGGVAP